MATQAEQRRRNRVNREARGRYRRTILEELGFRNIGGLSNEQLDRMIDNPSGLRALVDNIERTGNKPSYGILKDLESKGVRLPVSTTEKMYETRTRKYFERINLAKHYAEDIIFDTGATTPLEIGVEVEALRVKVKDLIKDIIDKHDDIEYTTKTGKHVKFTWGAKQGRQVRKDVLAMIDVMTGNQIMWLVNMVENGSLLSEEMNYDSNDDGTHTRFLASVRQLVTSAFEVGNDGIHPTYGSMSTQRASMVFRGINEENDELYENMTPEEVQEMREYIRKQSEKNIVPTSQTDTPDISDYES